MTIDIILISYNQEAYIAEAVNSILCQKVDDDVTLRLIVADDVSTDRTLEIIQQHLAEANIQHIFLPKEKNVGYVQNYKQAFAACIGDYVAILEGDDYWLEGHLQQHVDLFRSFPEVTMSMNSFNWINTDGRIGIRNWDACGGVKMLQLEDLIINGNCLGNLSACVFRTELIKRLPEKFFLYNIADWEIGVFMAQYGRIAILEEITSMYRLSNKGQWAGLSEKQKRSSIIKDLANIDRLFDRKYHTFCRKYEFKIKHPKLQHIKHRCGVALRSLFGK